MKLKPVRYWPIALFLILGSISVVSLAPLDTFLSRQKNGWSLPVALSPDTQSSWFPDIAADTTGLVHAVWSTSISTGVGQAYDVVMYAAAQPAAQWPAGRDLVALPSKGAVTRPTILVDKQGIVHLTFRSYTVYYSHVPVQLIAPAALLEPRPISSIDKGYF